MAYHLYHTEGFIAKRRPVKESDVLLLVFTEAFGWLNVLGRSIRSANSKLKAHAVCPNHVNLSLVRGREIWRLAALESTGLLKPMTINPDWQKLLIRITDWLARLMPTEAASQPIYRLIKDGFILLEKAKANKNFYYNLELVMALRILKILGYFDDHSSLGQFTAPATLDEAIIKTMTGYQKQAAGAITDSFLASSL